MAEPLSAAGPERPDCAACGLWGTCRSPGMRPFVPTKYTRRLLVVGEAAGKEEDDPRANRPFVGPAGKLLRTMLRECQYRDGEVAFVNAVRCRPPGNATPTMRQVRCCRPFLLQTVETLRPATVVGMGATALRALTNDGSRQNVTAERGRNIHDQVPGLRGTHQEAGGSRLSSRGLPGSDDVVASWGRDRTVAFRDVPGQAISICSVGGHRSALVQLPNNGGEMGTGLDAAAADLQEPGTEVTYDAILPVVSRSSGAKPREVLGEAPYTSPPGVPGSPSVGAVWVTYHPAAALYPGGTHLPVYIREDLRRSRRELVSGVPGGESSSRGVYEAIGRLETEGIGIDTCGVGLDTEWSPTGDLLTVGLADGKGAVAFETGEAD